MENRSVFFGVASIGAVIALISGVLRPATPAAPASNTRTEEVRQAAMRVPPQPVAVGADTSALRGRGAELIEAFLWRDLGSRKACGKAATPPCFGLDVVIATLPDPYDSHLDWAYDSNLEAIRRAFETADFVTDRFWIPARDDSVLIPVHRSTSQLAARNARPDSVRVAAREAAPGVILFRHRDPEKHQLRLLYLVGEIPTGGIHKGAFQHALRERRWLFRQTAVFPRDAVRNDTVLKVLGPTFSGSALSLRRVLEPWQAQDKTTRVSIVSGSATSTSVARTLTDSVHRIGYEATVNPDSLLDLVLWNSVLPRLKIEPSQVALLTESSTEYGRSRTEQTQPGAAPEPSDTSRTPADSAGPGRGKPLVIPVPMNIYSLRTEYEKNPVAAAPQARLPGPSNTPRLPLSLQDAARPKEAPPVISPLTPPLLDLMLDEIVRTLRQHDIRAVGLQATDVRDKLFLGELIRKRVRDVQLFTYESSALFRRTDFTESLRGMLVLSSYPLVFENQRWVRSSTQERIPFASDGAEGVFNAALLLLGEREALLEFGVPRSVAAGDSARQRPPVWLTVLGNNTLLPLQIVPGDSVAAISKASGTPKTDRPEVHGKDAPAVHPQEVGFYALSTTFALGLLVLFLAGRSLPRTLERNRKANEYLVQHRAGSGKKAAAASGEEAHSDQDRKDPRDDVLPEGVERGSLLIHQELYTILLFLALAGMALPSSVMIAHAVGWPKAALAFAVPVLVFWTMAVGLSCHGCWLNLRGYQIHGWQYLWHDVWRSGRMAGWMWVAEVLGRLFIAVVGVLYFVVSLLYAWDLAHLGGTTEPFLLRALRIESGTSPLLPLAISGAGFAIWCSWHLLRVQLLAQPTVFEEVWLNRVSRSESPSWPARNTAGARLVRAVREVRAGLFRLVPDTMGLWLFVALAAVSGWLLVRWGQSLEALILAPYSVRGWEFTSFDVLFRFGVLGTFGATSWAVYRLLITWRGLHNVLASVAETPLISAFERLPPQVARMTQLSLFGSVPRDSATAVAADQWQCLHHIASASVKPILEAGAEPQPSEEMLNLLRVTSSPTYATGGAASDPHQHEVARLRRLYRVVEDLWKAEPNAVAVASFARELDQSGAAEKLAGTSTTGRFRRSFEGPARLWLRVAEEIAAVQVVGYVDWVLRHFRRLALFLLLSLLFTTALLSSYPFQPQSLVRLIFFFVLVATIGSLLYVMVQMNRNEVMSRITKTIPGRITWDTTFVLNVVLFAVVPLLALVSSEFPTLRNVLFAWLDPLIQSMTKL